MPFQIATSLAGKTVWFAPDEPIPPGVSNVRLAPPNIVTLAQRILDEDAYGEPSAEAGAYMCAALDELDHQPNRSVFL